MELHIYNRLFVEDHAFVITHTKFRTLALGEYNMAKRRSKSLRENYIEDRKENNNVCGISFRARIVKHTNATLSLLYILRLFGLLPVATVHTHAT